jgi:MFS family permease
MMGRLFRLPREYYLKKANSITICTRRTMFLSVQTETAAVQTRETYEAEVRENFKWNGPLGIIQGLALYLNTGLHNVQVVVPAFLYEITGSNTFVGVASSLQLYAHNVPQLFGSALVEHLPVKKPAMVKFGWLSALCWLIIAAATYFLPREANLPIFLIFYAASSAFMGLYLLVWTDVMSKVIPVERRGNYFGVRNFLSTLVTAAGSSLAGYFIANYLFPNNYVLTYFFGFVFFALALLLLALTREPVAWRIGQKMSFPEKLRSMPGIFRDDPNFFRFCCLRAAGAGFCQMSLPFYIIFAEQRLLGANIGLLVAYLGSTLHISRAVGNLFWGLVAQKSGYKAPLELSFTIFALAAVIAIFSHSYPTFLLVFIINGLAQAGLMMSTHNILMEFGQIQNRATYIGISAAISGLIGGLAPLVGGLLSDYFSFQVLFLATACISVFSTVAMRHYVQDPRHVEMYKL